MMYIITHEVDINDKNKNKEIQQLFGVTDKKIREYKQMYDDSVIIGVSLETFIGKPLTKIGNLLALYSHCNLQKN